MWYGLDWGVVGGESGPRARPCNVDWIRSIIGQFKAADRPVFCKQLGAVPIDGSLPIVAVDSFARGADWMAGGGAVDRLLKLTSRKGGDPAEWPEDLRVREMPR